MSVTSPIHISNRDKILSDWAEAKRSSAYWREQETNLRAQVVEAFSTETDAMKAGVENVDLPQGYTLKIEHSLKYELDKADDFEKVDKACDEIERVLGEEVGALIVERLIKRKLEISVTEYKKLPDKAKAIVDKVLTIKPGPKSVEIKPPAGAS